MFFYHTPQHHGGTFKGTGASACSPRLGKVVVLESADPSRVELSCPLLYGHFNQISGHSCGVLQHVGFYHCKGLEKLQWALGKGWWLPVVSG